MGSPHSGEPYTNRIDGSRSLAGSVALDRYHAQITASALPSQCGATRSRTRSSLRMLPLPNRGTARESRDPRISDDRGAAVPTRPILSRVAYPCEIEQLIPPWRRYMVLPQPPSIGSPLLIPFDGSVNAEVVLPHVPCLVGTDRKVVLMQVVPTAQAITSPLGTEMWSPEEVQRLSRIAAEADLGRAAATIREQLPEAE